MLGERRGDRPRPTEERKQGDFALPSLRCPAKTGKKRAFSAIKKDRGLPKALPLAIYACSPRRLRGFVQLEAPIAVFRISAMSPHCRILPDGTLRSLLILSEGLFIRSRLHWSSVPFRPLMRSRAVYGPRAAQRPGIQKSQPIPGKGPISEGAK